MKKIPLLSLLLFSFCRFSYAQNPDSTAILTVMQQQINAWNSGDIDAFMAGYWKSDSLTFITHKGVKQGWEAMRQSYKKGYPTKEAMGFLSFDSLTVQILSKDIAYVIGRWNVDPNDPKKQGRFTLLFRRFPEGWRIVSDHTD